MNRTCKEIGVAVIELAGRSALQVSATELRREAGQVAGICRGKAPGPQPAGIIWIADAGDAVPTRRHRGGKWLLEVVRADLVVLVEDTTDFADGWALALQEGFADAEVGCLWGPVAVSPDLPARFRALGRLEYGRFAAGDRPVSAPPGNALALRGSIVARHLETRDGIIEAELAETLAAMGQHMSFNPGFRAVYARHDAHGARLATRFQHGRLYASEVAFGAGPARRSALALRSLAVPAVLSLRALKAAVSGGGLGPAITEAGWIVAMSVAWGFGECIGVLFGPGQSRGSWR